MQSSSSVPREPKTKFKSLLTLSIINILLFALCVGLELANPFIFQGVWGSITFIIAGLLGLSVSFSSGLWEKSLIIATTIFSTISIISATICCIISVIGYTYVYPECSYVWNNITDKYDYVCSYTSYTTTQLVLVVAFCVAWVNNIVVTVLCSQTICKCCRPAAVHSSIPIVIVQNPQQLSQMWTISPTGTQFQTYPTVVYSPYQQQPMNQQEQHQPPFDFSTSKTEQPMNFDDSPPPYSMVNTLDPTLNNESYNVA